jgi:mannose-1-phosphate guanylyltransferase/mannose-6-phosphate isomerase
MSIHVLIMAGGNGTRFWPVSTPSRPKQYTSLASNDTLIQESIKRSLNFTSSENIYVVTVERQTQLAAEQSKGLIPEDNIIVEPEGRNTAPCIFLGLLEVLKKGVDKKDCIVVLPSDHVIKNKDAFCHDINLAVENAQKRGSITVIGIPPTSPHTGYGYINKGEGIAGGLYVVNKFVEKPQLETAIKYLKSGEYFWNAGMFISSIENLIDEISLHAPSLGNYQDALFKAIGNSQQVKEVYGLLPKESIDYAVIEKSSRVDVVSSSFDWNDLGSWDALEEVIEPSNNNTVCTANATQFLNSKGNIIFAPDKKVSLVNCDDLVIVVEGDHVIVLPKKDAQKVKELNQQI